MGTIKHLSIVFEGQTVFLGHDIEKELAIIICSRYLDRWSIDSESNINLVRTNDPMPLPPSVSQQEPQQNHPEL